MISLCFIPVSDTAHQAVTALGQGFCSLWPTKLVKVMWKDINLPSFLPAGHIKSCVAPTDWSAPLPQPLTGAEMLALGEDR